MRAALEAAMGSVITNPAACDEFVRDPAGFAAQYDLDPAEVASLLAMQDDLTDLMPGFVQKRRNTLRGSSVRTLQVLGPAGWELLTGYLSHEAPHAMFREERLAFADFLVEHCVATAADREHGRFIADVARYERAIICSQHHSRPLGSSASPPEPYGDPATVDPDRPLHLANGSSLESFGWDLRPIRSFTPQSPETAPADRCVLLFFHTGGRKGERISRIRPDCAPAIAMIADQPGTSTRAASAICMRPELAINTLRRLVSDGGIA
jgi:hypothetical protein